MNDLGPGATYRDIVGRCIFNPHVSDNSAWVLNVVGVTDPDPITGFVIITAVEGVVAPVVHDMNWQSLEVTPAMADLMTAILAEELDLLDQRSDPPEQYPEEQ